MLPPAKAEPACTVLLPFPTCECEWEADEGEEAVGSESEVTELVVEEVVATRRRDRPLAEAIYLRLGSVLKRFGVNLFQDGKVCARRIWKWRDEMMHNAKLIEHSRRLPSARLSPLM